MKHPGLPQPVKAELDRNRLKWKLVQRTNHDAIVVGDKVVTYIGRSQPQPRCVKNMVAAVRRFAQGRELNKYRKDS